ncbi:hypothetical protein PoB_004139300 [Plakobranchus ocellatus]|uniref:Uncharacterized protein n=1 Tax=Plakobranchus ocellatus TaxID=259542 RepID=A0AAV4B5K5_9GAST|nr:hypothetical protein PoB_004139300 [Plakobranchus ocellatus]
MRSSSPFLIRPSLWTQESISTGLLGELHRSDDRRRRKYVGGGKSPALQEMQASREAKWPWTCLLALLQFRAR